jgi:two-component system cell cycle response regulator
MSAQIAAKVLLVDDDELVSRCLGSIIAAAGYEVTTAADAKAALVSMHQDFSSIVILDVNLPGMDGLDLCRAIRRQTYSGYVYLMLHTTKDADTDILAGLEAGADDYLSKSTPKSQLVGRLRTAQRILTLEYSLKSALGERELMAMTDVLTGAFNRRYLLQHLHNELTRSQRAGGELSLLMLDFDNFSYVNDRYGHAAGDMALTELVKRIQACLLRESDWCARLGGDEFVIVLPQTDLTGARVIADKLLNAVNAAPIHTGAGIVRMTVSIGGSGLGAIPDREPSTVETLLDLADQCLYQSKNAGRNQATMVEPRLHQKLRFARDSWDFGPAPRLALNLSEV